MPPLPPDDPEEIPLDPALLRVERRLRRLMLIAGLTLGGGFLALVFALLFRLSTFGETRVVPPFSQELALPSGMKVIAASAAGETLSLTLDGPKGQEIRLIDLKTGRLKGILTIVSPP